MADDVFKCFFVNENDGIPVLNFTEMISHESNWQSGNIGSGNDLAPNWRQVIIWTIC